MGYVCSIEIQIFWKTASTRQSATWGFAPRLNVEPKGSPLHQAIRFTLAKGRSGQNENLFTNIFSKYFLRMIWSFRTTLWLLLAMLPDLTWWCGDCIFWFYTHYIYLWCGWAVRRGTVISLICCELYTNSMGFIGSCMPYLSNCTCQTVHVIT